MKPGLRKADRAFTLGELMVAIGISSLLMGALLSSSVALRKSFAAADDFFSTHVQQIRIIDYLGRDVKRSTVVTTSVDRQTVTCAMPNYIQSSVRKNPIILVTSNGPRVDYGRLIQDAVITFGSTTLISATANFTAADVGRLIVGEGIKDGVTIAARTGATTITMSDTATASATNVSATISPQTVVVYSVNTNTQSIVRTENGVVTTIASSTDQLVPNTLNVALANTEYADTNVTFRPTFTFPKPSPNPSATPDPVTRMKRDGTAIYARSYLRNQRRPTPTPTP
jgi:prepilin-type N-terminal cleavage/methylation domain